MAEFLPILKANVPFVLQEKGCRKYIPTMDVMSGFAAQEHDDHVVTILEQWESLDDLRAHMKAAHMISYHEKTREIVKKVQIKVLTAV